jgi:rare lipoprotein A (peptidoglycan hydrolase)
MAGTTTVALFIALMPIAGCGESAPTIGTPAPQATVSGVSGSTVPSVSASPATGSSTALAPAKPRSSGSVPPAHPVPASFQPAPGAPSDAEVQRELAQMAAVQRRQQQQALSAAAANLAGLLPWSLEPKVGVHASVASVFTDYGLGLACGGVLGRDQLGVAHKTAPCGTLITFAYAGRSLTVPVIDRGPYIAGREWDLTGATAAALAFPGLGQIQWSVAG